MDEPNTSPDTLFRCSPIMMTDASRKNILVRLWDGMGAEMLPVPLANFLVKYTAFSTFSTYAKSAFKKARWFQKLHLMTAAMQYCMRYRETLPFRFRFFTGVLEEALAILQENHFVTRLDHFVSPPGEKQKEELDRISLLGMVTCNRPQTAKNNLLTYIQNAKHHNRKIQFAVFDDSKNQETQQAIASLNSEQQVDIAYIGRSQKEAYIEALVKKGFPPTILRFALFGTEDGLPTYGANRNAFLLYTAGQMAFSCDDDTSCRVGKAPNFKEGIRVASSEWDFQQIWSMSNRKEVLQQIPSEEVDILKHHESVLGRPIRSIVRDQVDNGHAQDLDTEMMDGDLMRLTQKGSARVVISINGLIGDSGMGAAESLVFVRDEERERLLKSEEIYKQAFESREILKSAEKTSVVPASSFMSTFFALDNRQLLPPFIPVLRNEDNLFGNMTGKLINGCCIAYLPFALLHSPDEVRRYYDFRKDLDITPFPSDLINHALRETFSWTKPHELSDGLKYFGSYLIKLGSRSDSDFKQFYREVRMKKLTDACAILENFLEKYPKSPRFWKADARSLLQGYKRLLKMNDVLPLPTQILEKYGELDGFAQIKKIISRYGDLLVHWPDIIAAMPTIKKTS